MPAAVKYLNRALAHHMQYALDLENLPLVNDAEAQRWCGHDEVLVRLAVLHAIGREEFVKILHWLSDVKGKYFQASTMLFTLAADQSVFDQTEKRALLVQSAELLGKAKEAPGWDDTKERLQFEFDINQKMLTLVELG